MPVTITGGKYAQVTLVTTTLSAGISAADTSIALTSAAAFPTSGNITIGNESIAYTGKSTNTLTGCTRASDGTTAAAYASGVSVQLGNPWNIYATAATFTVADFAPTARAVALFTSGNVFRGIAYARGGVSTTQINLATRFFDPVDGSVVQVADGDSVLVSKTFSEIATTGVVYTIVGNIKRLAVTDTVTFGTAGQQNSLFVFEDNAIWDGSGYQIILNGGVVLLGRCVDYATREIVNHCTITTGMPATSSPFVNSSAANFVMFGGILGNSAWMYGNGTPGTPVAQTFVCMGVTLRTNAFSPDSGAAFASNASRQVLDTCKWTRYGLPDSSTLMLRFGDGVIRGGTWASIPIAGAEWAAIFGADSSITATIAAKPSERAVVLDAGGFPNLWRSSGAPVTQVITFVNLVSALLTSRYTDTSLRYDYRDNFTNLRASTLLAAIRDSDWSTEATATAPAADGSVQSVTIRHRTASGQTVTASRAPFTIRLRRYGFDALEQAVADTTYQLLGGTSAIHLTFGGLINQIARHTLTAIANEATALAVTGISVTNHGASPVTWNSKSWSVTVTADTSVNAGLTAALIWAHVTAKISATATWGGQAGHLWHVLVDEADGGGYRTLRGVSGGAGAALKGVRVINQNGDPFPGFVALTADDGTTYVPPATATLTVAGVVDGSRLLIRKVSDGSVLVNAAVSGTSYNYSYQVTSDIPVAVVLRKATSAPYYIEWSAAVTLTANDATITAAQQLDT